MLKNIKIGSLGLKMLLSVMTAAFSTNPANAQGYSLRGPVNVSVLEEAGMPAVCTNHFKSGNTSWSSARALQVVAEQNQKDARLSAFNKQAFNYYQIRSRAALAQAQVEFGRAYSSYVKGNDKCPTAYVAITLARLRCVGLGVKQDLRIASKYMHDAYKGKKEGDLTFTQEHFSDTHRYCKKISITQYGKTFPWKLR